MKRFLAILGVLLLTVAIVWAWFEFERFSVTREAREMAKESVLIVYATYQRTDPKAPLIIKEIWKDERKTTSPLLGLSLGSSTTPSNQMPDGAVVFFKSLDRSEPATYVFVRNGVVDFPMNGKFVEMNLDQFNITCGLQ